MLHKIDQQFEFLAGKDQLFILVISPAGQPVGPDIAVLQHRFFPGFRPVPQRSPHPRSQLPHGKWFGQVIVRPQIQALNPVVDLPPRREHDHADPGFLAQL